MPTFREVAKLAYEHRKSHKVYRNNRSIERWNVIIEKYLNPTLGDIEISDITTDDIVTALEPTWRSHSHTTSLARAIAKYIFGYAIRKKMYPQDGGNPAEWKDCISFDLPAINDIHTVQHRESATVGEIQRIMPKLATSKFLTKKCLAFGILCVGRASEWSQAKWSEIDFEERVLHVPQNRCKVKLPDGFSIPLSVQAIKILKSLPRTSEYVFDTKGKGKPIANSGLLQMLKKQLPNHQSVTLHGCRSAFSSWCAETMQEPTLREACLMHIEGNKVSQAYQRSELIEQRRPLMQAWADAIFHE